MQYSDNRSLTFDINYPLNKKIGRYWTHDVPSPQQLADCGFYFTPTKKYGDQITCFSCRRKETNVNGISNIVDHHLAQSPDCPLSLIYSHKINYMSCEESSKRSFWQHQDPLFRDLISQKAIQLRKKTFGRFWKFDKGRTRNTKLSSQSLAESGFYYCPPNEDIDDKVECVYCKVTLESWEAGDDPQLEHQKNAREYCYFLEKSGGTYNQSISSNSINLDILSDDEEQQFSSVDENELFLAKLPEEVESQTSLKNKNLIKKKVIQDHNPILHIHRMKEAVEREKSSSEPDPEPESPPVEQEYELMSDIENKMISESTDAFSENYEPTDSSISETQPTQTETQTQTQTETQLSTSSSDSDSSTRKTRSTGNNQHLELELDSRSASSKTELESIVDSEMDYSETEQAGRRQSKRFSEILEERRRIEKVFEGEGMSDSVSDGGYDTANGKSEISEISDISEEDTKPLPKTRKIAVNATKSPPEKVKPSRTYQKPPQREEKNAPKKAEKKKKAPRKRTASQMAKNVEPKEEGSLRRSKRIRQASGETPTFIPSLPTGFARRTKKSGISQEVSQEVFQEPDDDSEVSEPQSPSEDEFEISDSYSEVPAPKAPPKPKQIKKKTLPKQEELQFKPPKQGKIKLGIKKDPIPVMDLSNQDIGDYGDNNLQFIEDNVKAAKPSPTKDYSKPKSKVFKIDTTDESDNRHTTHEEHTKTRNSILENDESEDENTNSMENEQPEHENEHSILEMEAPENERRNLVLEDGQSDDDMAEQSFIYEDQQQEEQEQQEEQANPEHKQQPAETSPVKRALPSDVSASTDVDIKVSKPMPKSSPYNSSVANYVDEIKTIAQLNQQLEQSMQELSGDSSDEEFAPEAHGTFTSPAKFAGLEPPNPPSTGSSKLDPHSTSSKNGSFKQKDAASTEDTAVSTEADIRNMVEDMSIQKPAGLDQISQKLQNMEEAFKYLENIANAPYSLMNDLGGELTQFIAALPPEEEDMTIKQWLEHSARNCQKIVREACDEMIENYRAERDKALKVLEGLPTSD
ncbi:hypothetical protein PSN45_002881 [Yamadazyma tenuis]|nr:hypothetical protein PSN45_002881 [Yamadazyma tenuis]